MTLMKQSELAKMTLELASAKHGPNHAVTIACRLDYESLLKAEERRETGIYRENPMDNYD